MNLIAVLTDLCQLGARLPNTMFSTVHGYYTLNVNADKPEFVWVPDQSILAPLAVDRTAEAKPNYLYDTTNFVLGLNPKRRQAFWDRAVEALRQYASRERVSTVTRLAESAVDLRVEFVDPPKNSYLAVLTGRKACPRLNIKKPEDAPPHIVKKGSYIFLADSRGKPLIQDPKFADWWKKSFAQLLADPVPGGGESIDLITGRPCVPNRLHLKVIGVPGTGSKAAVISFNEASYCFEELEEGNNFPMSSESVFRYVSALNHQIENDCAAVLSDSLMAVFWTTTDDGYTCPIIGPTCRILEGFMKPPELEKEWQTLVETEVDDTLISVLLLKGTKGRVTFLSYDRLTARELQQNMLEFLDDFGGHVGKGGVQVQFRNLLAMGKAPKANPFVPKQYLPYVAWSVIFGKAYPKGLASRIYSINFGGLPYNSYGGPEYPTRVALQWISALQRRSVDMTEKRKQVVLPIGGTIDWKSVTQDTPMPSIDRYVSASPPQRIGYLFGRHLSLVAGLKGVFHLRDPKAVKAERIFEAGRNNPQKWFERGEVLKVPLYLSNLSKFSSYRDLEAQYDEVMGELQSYDFSKRLDRQNQAAILFGWNAQTRYNKDLFQLMRLKRELKRAATEETNKDKAAE